MIYLRKFESFDNNHINYIINNIEDILTELTDDNDWDSSLHDQRVRDGGWVVECSPINDNIISIKISKSQGFIRSQSNEVSLRIDQYLSNEGYKIRYNKFDGYVLWLTYRLI